MSTQADILREATDWLVRLHEPAGRDGDLLEWTLWYEADERHRRAFEQMRQLWDAAGALAQGPDGAARIQRLLATPQPPARWPMSLASRWALAAAAAAAIVGLAWMFSPRPLSSPSPVASLRLVRQMTLPDGTAVELAPKTRITLRYTAAARQVALSGGEAYFAVRHDPARPFILTVNGLTVRDVGTAFNVHSACGRTVVTVVRGEVEVSQGPAARGRSAVQVRAGQEVKWQGSAQPVVRRADAGRTLAWRQGRLEYIDAPLSSVIADVDRYTRHPVVIGDPEAGRIAFTGTVFARYADQWVRALPGEFPVRLVSSGGGTLLLESRPDRSR